MSPHATPRRAHLVGLALTAALLAAVSAAASAAEARDRAPVLLGPVEPLADRPGMPDDDTGSALLARNGDGVTAFLQDGYDDPTYARDRRPDGTWTPQQEVPCVSARLDPQYCEIHGAAVGSSGELVALVHLYARRTSALAVSVRAAGQTMWSNPKIVNGRYLVAGDYKPSIASSPRGAIVVTFGDFDRNRPMALIAVHLAPGKTWGSATYHRLPTVAWPEVSGLSRRGQAVVVYTSESGISAPVMVARLLPGRGWSTPTRIGTGWSENYAVAMDLDGRAVVTWLETTEGEPSTLTAQSQRVRVMSPQGRWSSATVLARGERGTSGNAYAWIRGEVGVAWGPWIGSAVRVAVKPIGRPWRKVTVAGGDNAGAMRSVDLNTSGDLVLTWENWREGEGYSLGLALLPKGGDWSAPRLVYTDLQDWASGSAITQPDGSVIVAYGDDDLRQVVARRVHLNSSVGRFD